MKQKDIRHQLIIIVLIIMLFLSGGITVFMIIQDIRYILVTTIILSLIIIPMVITNINNEKLYIAQEIARSDIWECIAIEIFLLTIFCDFIAYINGVDYFGVIFNFIFTKIDIALHKWYSLIK